MVDVQSIEYSGSDSPEESKEKFEGLLAKWDEIFQREMLFTSGKVREEEVVVPNFNLNLDTLEPVNAYLAESIPTIWESETGKLSCSYDEKSGRSSNLSAALSLSSITRSVREDISWKFEYVAANKKNISFAFAYYKVKDIATLKLSLGGPALFIPKANISYEKADSSSYEGVRAESTEAEYDVQCKVSYGNSDYGDERLRFFSAIGKKDVFTHANKLFNHLSERIAREKKAALEEKQAAEKKAKDEEQAAKRKAFDNALSDL